METVMLAWVRTSYLIILFSLRLEVKSSKVSLFERIAVCDPSLQNSFKQP